jgi:diguanylate cyclase (GGDEF)-like protein
MLKLPIAVVQQLVSGWLFDVDVQGKFHGVYGPKQYVEEWFSWVGKQVVDVWPSETSTMFHEALTQLFHHLDQTVKSKRAALPLNGKYEFFSMSVLRLPDTGRLQSHLSHVLVWMQPEREANEDLFQMAFFDSLTGLANRRLLYDHITQAVRATSRTKQWGAILFLDLDGFKQINDQWGHAAGDDILRQVAQRLTYAVRKTDTVARLGGDEFVILLHHLDTTKNTAIHGLLCVTDHLLKLLSDKAFVWRLHPVKLSASIGAVLFSEENAPHLNVDELIHQADAAMYQAKAAGKNTSHLALALMPTAFDSQNFIQNQTNSPQCDGRVGQIECGEMTSVKQTF